MTTRLSYPLMYILLPSITISLSIFPSIPLSHLHSIGRSSALFLAIRILYPISSKSNKEPQTPFHLLTTLLAISSPKDLSKPNPKVQNCLFLNKDEQILTPYEQNQYFLYSNSYFLSLLSS